MRSLKIATGCLSSLLAVILISFSVIIYEGESYASNLDVYNPTEMVVTEPIYDNSMPEQSLDEELKEQIDDETERDWYLDDPIEDEYPVTYEENTTYYEESSSNNVSSYNGDFKSAGVVYGDDGTRYTWYSQNVLPGGGLTELNNNGRHVDENGYICDGDGYIAVASSDYPQGTVVDTPFGPAKVYDSGCSSGTIDVYTDF